MIPRLYMSTFCTRAGRGEGGGREGVSNSMIPRLYMSTFCTRAGRGGGGGRERERERC